MSVGLADHVCHGGLTVGFTVGLTVVRCIIQL